MPHKLNKLTRFFSGTWLFNLAAAFCLFVFSLKEYVTIVVFRESELSLFDTQSPCPLYESDRVKKDGLHAEKSRCRHLVKRLSIPCQACTIE